jgi:hypothetical protein
VTVERRVKRELVTGDFAVADEALGEVDDVIAMWKVERARDAAWTSAETLRALDSAPDLAEAYFLALDRMVGFASRGLLQPAGS